MKEASITRRIEFDAGHRIPDHKSKCRNPHGHRYVVEASMLGPVSETVGDTTSGMVMDFSDLKDAMNQHLHDHLDHGFMVYKGDEALASFLAGMDFKFVLFPYVPTAENIAVWCYDRLKQVAKLPIYKVKVSETPNCWAIYKGQDAETS